MCSVDKTLLPATAFRLPHMHIEKFPLIQGVTTLIVSALLDEKSTETPTYTVLRNIQYPGGLICEIFWISPLVLEFDATIRFFIQPNSCT